MCVRVAGWTAQGLKDLALVLQTRGTQLAARRHLNRLVDKGRESSERLVVSFDTNHREEEEEGGCAAMSATSCHRGRGKQALILACAASPPFAASPLFLSSSLVLTFLPSGCFAVQCVHP